MTCIWPVALALGVTFGAGQTAKVGTVSGRVIDGAAKPVAAAIVRLLRWPSGEVTTVLAGDDGTFDATVPPGPYTLSATKLGFLPSDWTVDGLGAVVMVSPSQVRRTSDLVVVRGATIRGRVLAAPGRPASQADVRLLRRQSVGIVVEQRVTTDATGDYVFSGLPPAEYIVGVSATAAPTVRTAIRTGVPSPAYYPGAPADSSGIAVETGQDIVVPDLLRPLTDAGQLIGVLRHPDGSPARAVSLRLRDETEQMGLPRFAGGPGRTVTGDDGRFRFEDLAPGQYRMDARVDIAGTTWWLDEAIDIVPGQRVDATFSIRPGRTLRGRVTGAMDSLRLTRENVTVVATVDPTSSRFEIRGLGPGDYRVAGQRGGRAVAAILAGTVDLIDTGLPIALAEDPLELDLTVEDQTGRVTGRLEGPSPDTTWLSALIVPVDQRYWVDESRRVQHLLFLEDGQLPEVNLPSGPYAVAVFQGLTRDHGRETRWREQALRSGVRINVTPGNTTDLTLRAVR